MKATLATLILLALAGAHVGLSVAAARQKLKLCALGHTMSNEWLQAYKLRWSVLVALRWMAAFVAALGAIAICDYAARATSEPGLLRVMIVLVSVGGVSGAIAKGCYRTKVIRGLLRSTPEANN